MFDCGNSIPIKDKDYEFLDNVKIKDAEILDVACFRIARKKEFVAKVSTPKGSMFVSARSVKSLVSVIRREVSLIRKET